MLPTEALRVIWVMKGGDLLVINEHTEVYQQLSADYCHHFNGDDDKHMTEYHEYVSEAHARYLKDKNA